MADIYKKLAKKLDRLPQGFPATSSGVELRILRKIFTPEDARFALGLNPMPETAEDIAKRLRRPLESTRAMLDRMASRGQIGSFRMDGVQKYAFMPFVVGIYEFQLSYLDKELADLIAEYAPYFMPVLGGTKPALSRVVPVNASIDAKAEILAYEDMRGLIREARSFLLNECICRKEKALQGYPCKHSLETCLAFSREEHAFDYFKHSGRVITKEEAARVLDLVEKEGLVHATYNVREDTMFVCNCCSCCCGFLRGLIQYRAPHVIARSNFVAHINEEECAACGTCAAERCPMQAICCSEERYTVLDDQCIGCGSCASTCPSGAIRLTRRKPAEQSIPPRDLIHWSVERASNRGGPLTRLALRLWLARNGIAFEK